MPKIRDLLAISAAEAGRDPTSVKLLAVSKTRPVDQVLQAASLGQRDFGENTVQEGLDKIRATADHGLTWHFIGHLQSNKTRAVAENFDWVHTIDTLKTARRLNQQRPETLPPLNVCLQVNIDAEEGKWGISADGLRGLAEACIELPNLRLRGLMCLPRQRQEFDEQRRPFAALRILAEQLCDGGIETDTLSMGMTGDFRAAIFEGATIVRIGTALFGART